MTWTLVGKGRVIEGPSWERGRIVEYEACLGRVVRVRAGGRQGSNEACCRDEGTGEIVG